MSDIERRNNEISVLREQITKVETRQEILERDFQEHRKEFLRLNERNETKHAEIIELVSSNYLKLYEYITVTYNKLITLVANKCDELTEKINKLGHTVKENSVKIGIGATIVITILNVVADKLLK